MPAPKSSLDPRLRVLFLVSVAAGIFFLPRLWAVSSVFVALAILWMIVGLPPRRLVRQIYKLWGFALFLVISYALTRSSPAVDHWIHLDLRLFKLKLNLGGAEVGLVMVIRVVSAVVASQIARAGDPRAVATGLSKLKVPRMVAASIDAVLALLGDGARGRSGGGGGGGGGQGGGGGGGGSRGGGRNEEGPSEKFWVSVKRISRGDVGPLVHRLERQISRAEEHVMEHSGGDEKSRRFVRDVAIIAGVALTMLGVKALKILPGIPFAPGYKIIILTPLYIVASLLTRTRFGGTLTGLTMGTVAFLLGDGKYGIFEIFKHLSPGLVCDALVPVMVRGGRMPGGFQWSLFGALVGAARFATVFVIVVMVQAPAVAYAFLLPGICIHVGFGAASGYISYHVVRAVSRLREEYELANKELA